MVVPLTVPVSVPVPTLNLIVMADPTTVPEMGTVKLRLAPPEHGDVVKVKLPVSCCPVWTSCSVNEPEWPDTDQLPVHVPVRLLLQNWSSDIPVTVPESPPGSPLRTMSQAVPLDCARKNPEAQMLRNWSAFAPEAWNAAGLPDACRMGISLVHMSVPDSASWA